MKVRAHVADLANPVVSTTMKSGGSGRLQNELNRLLQLTVD